MVVRKNRRGTSPAHVYLGSFAQWLKDRGYAAMTTKLYMAAADRFIRWALRRCALDRIDDRVLAAYVDKLGRRPRPGRRSGRRPLAADASKHFVTFLREQGVVAAAAASAPATVAEHLVRAYDEYMKRVGGLASTTRSVQCRYAKLLLDWRFGEREPDCASIGAEDLSEFTRREATRLGPSSSGLPVKCVRAFVRYLVSRGMVRAGLEGAVPTIRQWKHASLPKGLTPEELERVLAVCSARTIVAVRDRAVLLLLARLGLRSGEVVALDLDHLRWTEGAVLIAGGKSHRERLLPLSDEVGRALVAYLRTRPGDESRRVFLRCVAPRGPLTAAAVGDIARRYMERARVPSGRRGAHVLRHTAATQMVRRGASFKAVADILGHARLDTTAVYAKLDVENLARLPLPWPGAAL
jgi:site-specific recombinase XerD